MAAAPPAPAKGGGNILTRKFGPLPGWAWAGLGVLGYYIYKQRKASAAAAASTSTATPTSTLPGTSSAAPSGYGYQGPGTYNYQGPGPIPTGAVATTGGTLATSSNQQAIGQSYGPGVGNETPYTDANGNQYADIPTYASAVALLQQGQTIYYQPTPGLFLPAGSNGQLAPGILNSGDNLFTQIPASSST